MKVRLSLFGLYFGLCSVVFLLGGCASAIILGQASRAHSNKVIMQKKLAFSDTIIAFGVPAIRGLENDNKLLALVGEKNTYVLAVGIKELAAMAQPPLDGTLIEINAGREIPLDIKDDYFKGALQVRYNKSLDLLDKEEKNHLQKIGFQVIADGRMQLLLDVEGRVFAKPANYNQIAKELSLKRQVNFFTSHEKLISNKGSFNAIDLLFSLPAAIVFDVYTLPVQVLFLGAAMNHMNQAKPK